MAHTRQAMRRMIARLVAAQGKVVPDEMLFLAMYQGAGPPQPKHTLRVFTVYLRAVLPDGAVGRFRGHPEFRGYRLAPGLISAAAVADVPLVLQAGALPVVDEMFDRRPLVPAG
jgi:hypothetical protein